MTSNDKKKKQVAKAKTSKEARYPVTEEQIHLPQDLPEDQPRPPYSATPQ